MVKIFLRKERGKALCKSGRPGRVKKTTLGINDEENVAHDTRNSKELAPVNRMERVYGAEGV